MNLIEPYIEVSESLWTVDYEEIIKHGKEHELHKYSNVNGNPILVYNDLMYVVDHNEKTARITQRYLDPSDNNTIAGGIQRGR